ncbi:MAG: glycoside hydrolase family 15 protein [Micromonosporaceae bacterium]|nr:glycoside hydrolase family 15 protein [Micromonosporaceae bacterium]
MLREYAFIADGHRGALLGPHGDVAWLCIPQWNDEAVFSALVGGRGCYVVSPTDPHHVWGGSYEAGSLVWHSRWVTTDSIIECREALACPSDPSRAVLLRRIMPVRGNAHVRVVLQPMARFGREPLRDLRRQPDGSWIGRTGALTLRWTGAAAARVGRDGALFLELVVPAGRIHDLVLEIGTLPLAGPPPDPERAWRRTVRYWTSAAPDPGNVLAAGDVRHANAVLHGMTVPGGGTVAAATMGLPERAEAGRSYDYRYAWIRDQCYIGLAAAAAGIEDLLDASLRFVTARLLADGPRTAPVYTTTGGPVPAEQDLPFLTGYPGGRPRAGNKAGRQFQLDTMGEIMLLLAEVGRRGGLDSSGAAALELAADVIANRWEDADSGIWELRPRRWTHSRLMCVAGLRAAAAVAPRRLGRRWRDLARQLLAEATAHQCHPSGRWQRAIDDRRVDAALLLPALRGAVPLRDPRSVATYRAVLAELGRDGYIHRFRPDRRPLGEAEGAFLLCGFLAARSAHHLGERREAARWFERNRAACGPPGLFSEEYDVRQRQLRGNLPQAFVHAALVETALELST